MDYFETTVKDPETPKEVKTNLAIPGTPLRDKSELSEGMHDPLRSDDAPDCVEK